MFIYIPPALDTQTLQYSFVDRFGTEHDLTWNTSPNLFVPKGTKGLGLPDVDLVLEKAPFDPGSYLRYTKTGPLEIQLPLVIHHTSPETVLTIAENVRDWFYTGDERGSSPGYLRVKRPQDGTTRQIAVYYKNGLLGDMEEGSPLYVPYVITLVAPNPFWTDLEYSEMTFTSGDFSFTQLVTNVGDMDAYTIWTVGGPVYDFSITNTTTGKSISLTAQGGYSVLSGESITIDTRPAPERNRPPVYSDDGTNLYAIVEPTSSLQLWLVEGNNQIMLRGAGKTGSTTVHLQWLPKYRGVLR